MTKLLVPRSLVPVRHMKKRGKCRANFKQTKSDFEEDVQGLLSLRLFRLNFYRPCRNGEIRVGFL